MSATTGHAITAFIGVPSMLVPHILDGAADLRWGRVSDWNIRRSLDTIKAQPATSSQFGPGPDLRASAKRPSAPKRTLAFLQPALHEFLVCMMRMRHTSPAAR